MSRLWRAALTAVAGISERETLVARRGFDVRDAAVVRRLESIGGHFVQGYNAALGCPSLGALEQHLVDAPAADVAFRFEGAAMGLAVRDWMTPRSALFAEFVAGAAERHEYMTWVGRGWSFARLPGSPMRALQDGTSLARWLALDGYGFHQGYFGWRRFIVERQPVRGLPREAACVFDQGLGRSLWFVKGAQTAAVAQQVAAFAPERQPDLWAGIGLAAAYAGGLDASGMHQLRREAAACFPQLAQGIVFAAEARRRAGNPVPHTDAICRALLGLRDADAAQLAVDHRPPGRSLADYRAWREAIHRRFDNPALQKAA